MNILLDYFFPITSIEPTPAASTAFLKQACVVAKPKSPHVAGELTLCTSMSAVSALTDNTEAQQLFNAGMSRVYVLLADDLDLADFLEGHESDFFTLLISSDFADADVDIVKAYGTVTITSYANLLTTTADVITVAGVAFTAQSGAATLGSATFQAATSNNATAQSLCDQINAHATTSALVVATVLGAVVTITALEAGDDGDDIAVSYTDNGGGNIGATLAHLSGGKLSGAAGLLVGQFAGVIGIASTDDTKNATRAATTNYCAFHTTSGNKAKNMFYAFGKMLSNVSDWKNQQFITMPVADDVDTLGDANALFDDKVSFVLDDDEFGKRLGLFAVGGKAIVSPYIKRNLQIDMQSSALSYVSGNQPAYTKVQAALLQDELEKVMQLYVDRQWIEDGTVSVTLEDENFVAAGDINIAEPGALWRIFGEMRETL
jgi:hypothetical protein